MAWVKVLEEVGNEPELEGQWRLCFQQCIYNYDDATTQPGYRFIWRRPDNTLQAARGQARIEDAATLQGLLDAAKAQGWYR